MSKTQLITMIQEGKLQCQACNEWVIAEELEEERSLCKECTEDIPF